MSPPHPPFPLYLLPSIPFRRRRSSANSTSAFSTSSTPPSSPPTQPTSFLTPQPTSHLRCSRCLTDLIPTSSIISKGFTGRHGRAYLVSPPSPTTTSPLFPAPTTGLPLGATDLPNTNTHKPVPRQLVTGAHTVCDISCRQCGNVLGWKYVAAEEESQRYKVGKFILETKRVVRGVTWEGAEGDAEEVGGMGARSAKGIDDEIEFDSQDEEECEDLFAGVWSADVARKRRAGRGW